MNERERLIELIMDAPFGKRAFGERWSEETAETIADHLLSNGVTVQRWIPVTERLPENEGEHLLVCYSDGWICDQYTPFDNGVTHWMPMPERRRRK